MPHMVPQIERMSAWQIETSSGTECVSCDVCSAAQIADYIEGKPCGEAEKVTGWFARLSAPGYMDCTEWSGPHESEREARQFIAEMYDVDPDTGEDLE